jgi:DNA-binding Lrp family transcriptional regulator
MRARWSAATNASPDCRRWSIAALTGDADYPLRIVAVDLAAFTRLLNDEILGHGDVASLRSSIVLDRISAQRRCRCQLRMVDAPLFVLMQQ